MGKEGFVWWQGVVEDRHDPLYLEDVKLEYWDGTQKIKLNNLLLVYRGRILLHQLLPQAKREWVLLH